MQNQSPLRRLLLAAAASAAFGLTATAQAGPTLTPTGYANGSESFHIVVGSPSLNQDINAGGFAGTLGLDPILFWCYELDQFFGFGNSYTDYTATTVTPAAADLALAQLFTEALGPAGAASTTLFSAAFQLAVWEIRYDTGGTYDLSNGNFQVTGGPSATIAQAQAWLDGLGSTTPTYDVILLHSPSAQDFVTATHKPLQVPEPSPLPLLGVALAAMVMALRHRNGGLVQ